jgi:hypothetical protein
MPTLLEALAVWGVTEVETVAAAFTARSSKVLLLWLPFGRPRFRDAEGTVSGASTFSLLPFETLSSLAMELLGDDMIGLGSERQSSR